MNQPNQQVNQMMALARQQQGIAAAQQGVDVGACGPMAYNPGTGAPPMPGAPPIPGGMAGMGHGGYPAGVQGCQPAPAVPPGMLVQDGSIYQECFVPLGLTFGVDTNGNIYPESQIGAAVAVATGAAAGFQLFPRNGVFYIFGVKFFTGVGIAQLDSVITGDSDWNHLLGSTDVFSWNTDECFCPVNWGCISITNSLRITAHATTGSTDVEGVRGVAWGIRRASNYACGPTAAYAGMPVPGGY